MARLSDLLSPRLIRVGLAAADKKAALGELVDLFAAENPGADRDALVRELLRRERDGSTGIGLGCGIPHAHTDQVDRAHLVLGISRQGIEWEALDGEPVHLVFLVLSPVRPASAHLAVLEALSKRLGDDPLRRLLMLANSPEEVMELIGEAEEGLPQ